MLPKYEHTQKGSKLLYYFIIPVVFEVIAIEALVYILATRSSDTLSQNQLIFTMLILALLPCTIFGWVFLMMSSLTISIDNEFIRLKFGPGMWFKKIKLNQVVECKPVTNTWSNGWGIHYIGKKCWLYNIAGMHAVEITYQNGKKTRIGTDKPEDLAEAIRQTIA